MDNNLLLEIRAMNVAAAFDQANQYIAVGLTAATSALVLSSSRSNADDTSVDTSFGRMGRDSATLLLLAVCFVVGVLASFTIERSFNVASSLDAKTLAAVCTRASIATSPVGIRIAAAGLPACIAGGVLLHAAWRLRKDDGAKGLVMFAFVLALPYFVLGRFLLSVC